MKCPKCGDKKSHKCFKGFDKKGKPRESVKIIPKKKKIKKENQRNMHKSLQAIEERNNIEENIQADFCKEAYSTIPCYKLNFPTSVTADLPVFSEDLSREVEYNRENERFLPLEIRESGISGKGVFAKEEIGKGRIICLYIGEFCTNESCSMKNDSLFHVGWLFADEEVKEMFI